MEIDVSRFRAAFYVEAAEHLQSMEAALLLLESAPRDAELLNTIFRAAHSIKGASTTFGIDEVGRFTQVLENLLERLRDGLLETDEELIGLLLISVDVIANLVANAKDGAPLPANLDEVLNELKRANGLTIDVAAVPATESKAALKQLQPKLKHHRITISPSREFFRFGQDPLLLLRELSQIGTIKQVTVDDKKLPPIAEIEPEDCYLSWIVELESEASESSLHDVFMFLDAGSSYQIESACDAESKAAAVEARGDKEVGKSDAEPASLAPISAATLPSISTTEEDRRATSDRRTTAASSTAGSTASAGSTSAAATQPTAVAETVRVDRQLLDELINQIGEVVIGASMVAQDITLLSGGRTFESVTALEKTVR